MKILIDINHTFYCQNQGNFFKLSSQFKTKIYESFSLKSHWGFEFKSIINRFLKFELVSVMTRTEDLNFRISAPDTNISERYVQKIQTL